MNEEMIRIAGSCIFILIWIGHVSEGVVSSVMSVGLGVCMAVTEDDNFVDTEYGEGTRYVACHCGAEFVGLCIGDNAAW